ncbi:sodium- and chloride-dependent glycine transporter 1-like [Asterias rubens]|uniref:sodium- and chloride-dependent glycine transporter 1-like n=1 Tax=Asterias rubens TaxID=7604 RepID=UPI00145591CB|nr:sodium- and chloride-dependent glycine transporter 1-like [Asterias rubens]
MAENGDVKSNGDVKGNGYTKKPFTINGHKVKFPKLPRGLMKSSSTTSSNQELAEAVYDEDVEEGEPRGNWGNKMDFMLSSIGYAVGLGNVWRFPYLCYSNGGGAFLIPYVIMLLIAGLPIFVIEMGFGQFASRGCVSVWSMSPLFKGLGYAMCILSGLVAIYYNVVITYTVFYFFASFTSELPWSDCSQAWNTVNCVVRKANGTNSTFLTEYLNTSTRPSLEYWDRHVLGRSSGLEDLGPIRWQLALCLLFAWTVVFLCIVRGVQSSGKVVYFTATFPYVVLFILLIRGATLPGSAQGVLFYIRPEFSRLLDAKVWKDAAVQIFYSLGSAWGGLHTLASYNKFNNNFKRDGMIIAFTNCCTSVFAGFVIFSVIGFMAYDSGLSIERVADTGPGLAFVAYPEALARMPVAPLWSILFFFMLFTLGLDSEFVTMETLITALIDELSDFEYFKNIRKRKALVTFLVCFSFFLLGLPMTTNGGIYILTLMDNYSAGFSLLLVALTECIAISYVYGINRFIDDMEVMVPSGMGIYWKICLSFLSPLVLLFIFIFFCITYTKLEYNEYTYTGLGEALGWLMVLFAVLAVPAYAVFFVITKAEGDTLWERVKFSARPSPEWGPAANRHRKLAGYPPLGESNQSGVVHQVPGNFSPSSFTPHQPPPSYAYTFPNIQDGFVYHETSI